jgi:hypothetical protein
MKTHLGTSTASYGDSFTFYMQMKFVHHRKHTYGLPRPVMWIALLFYMQMTFVRHRKHAYGPPRPITGIALLLLYVDDVRTSLETHPWASAVCYTDSLSYYM